MTQPPRSLALIFAGPIVLAILSIAGLASALFGNGFWDVVSWIALGTPIATTAFFLLKRP